VNCTVPVKKVDASVANNFKNVSAVLAKNLAAGKNKSQPFKGTVA
jgi:hypothetical protein